MSSLIHVVVVLILVGLGFYFLRNVLSMAVKVIIILILLPSVVGYLSLDPEFVDWLPDWMFAILDTVRAVIEPSINLLKDVFGIVRN